MHRFPSVLLAVLALACADDALPTPDGGRDASPADAASDASLAPDAARDASLVDASRDAWVPPLPDATPGSETARCVELATGLRDRCGVGVDPQRVCQWHAYAALCGSGATDLLIHAMECLGDSGCPSLSDSSASTECLAAVHGGAEASPGYSAYSAIVSGCGGTPSVDAYTTAELLPYLADADAAALAACAGASCTIASIATACADEIPVIAGFACGG